MQSMGRLVRNWRSALGALAAALSIAATAPAWAAGERVYGGQVNGAGMPVTQPSTNDLGALPGSATLAAQGAKLDAQRVFAGVRLNDALAVEVTQKRPFGDASKPGDQALGVSGKATMPLTGSLSLQGQLGMQQHSRPALAAPELADTMGRSAVYGLGLAYATAGGLELRIESEHIAGRAGDPKAVSGDTVLLGARLQF